MPHTIVEVSEFDATITVPDDGDAAVAASVAASSPETLAQPLANRTRYLLQSNLGQILCGGFSGSGSLIFHDGIPLLNVGDAILSTANASSGTGSLSASTWYYVYAFETGGAIAFQVSTTAPSQSTGYIFKTGDTTKRYLTCFRTDGSGNMTPFYSRRGRYSYQVSATTSYSGPPLGVALTATTFTTLSLAAMVPPHVRQCSFVFYGTNNHASQMMSVEFRTTSGDVSGMVPTPVAPNLGFATTGTYVDALLDTSQQLQYELANGTPSDCSLTVTGFQE